MTDGLFFVSISLLDTSSLDENVVRYRREVGNAFSQQSLFAEFYLIPVIGLCQLERQRYVKPTRETKAIALVNMSNTIDRIEELLINFDIYNFHNTTTYLRRRFSEEQPRNLN